MLPFATRTLPTGYNVLAPDGSEVRVLQRMNGGSMAHFRLPAGAIARPVQHRTVEEMWFVVAGRGEMWRRQDGREEVVPLVFGTSLTIPLGTAFQFRAAADEPLDIVGCTMPPWPSDDEAYPVPGKWPPTV